MPIQLPDELFNKILKNLTGFKIMTKKTGRPKGRKSIKNMKKDLKELKMKQAHRKVMEEYCDEVV